MGVGRRLYVCKIPGSGINPEIISSTAAEVGGLQAAIISLGSVLGVAAGGYHSGDSIVSVINAISESLDALFLIMRKTIKVMRRLAGFFIFSAVFIYFSDVRVAAFIVWGILIVALFAIFVQVLP